MDINWLIVIWLIGAGAGLFYSIKGTRDAWGDLLAVSPDPIARDLAASGFKTQLVRGVIQLIWLLIGIVALLSIAGVLVLWGLVLTNYALAWLSREAYISKKRTLDAILVRNRKKEKE